MENIIDLTLDFGLMRYHVISINLGFDTLKD